ncbi:MAG: CoA ester lyase [Negativicutes bacterium]|nr:CoA ester lyase [Negativicutes bacterium]
MTVNYTQDVVRRSRLIMPANVKKYVEAAYLRNADAIILDLEDSVPAAEKAATRRLIKELIPIAGKGGSDILVRVNNTKEWLHEDLEATIWPGLAGIYLPMVESAEDVKAVDRIITELEQKRGIPSGQVKISLAIETVKGYLKMEEIAGAGERCDALSLGNEDFSLDSGMESSDETYHGWLIARMQIVFVARAYGLVPMLGSNPNYSDIAAYEKQAISYAKYGYLGSSCIHPGNVEILNKTFSPGPKEAEHARKVVAAFEQGLAAGRASVALEGKMIDYVHYKQAKKVFDRIVKIEEFEMKKKKAREALGG